MTNVLPSSSICAQYVPSEWRQIVRWRLTSSIAHCAAYPASAQFSSLNVTSTTTLAPLPAGVHWAALMFAWLKGIRGVMDAAAATARASARIEARTSDRIAGTG